MSANLHQTHGRNYPIALEGAPTGAHSGQPGLSPLALVAGSGNTQLLTHYGYYLSPRPTIQRLKK